MIPLDQMTDEQFERHAFELLRRELGMKGLIRFLRLHRSGAGDYTVARADWQKDLTIDELVRSIRAARSH